MATEKNNKKERIFEDNDYNTLPVRLINSYIYMSKYERGDKKYKHIFGYFMNNATETVRDTLGYMHMFISVLDFQYYYEKTTLNDYLYWENTIEEYLIGARKKKFPDDYNWLQGIGYGIMAILLEKKIKAFPVLRRIMNEKIASNYQQSAERGFTVHWGDASEYYAKSGLWAQALAAASRMAEHCEDELMMLHWQEKVYNYQTRCEQKSRTLQIKTDPELGEIDEKPTISNANKKKKSKSRTGKKRNHRASDQQPVKTASAPSENNASVSPGVSGVSSNHENGHKKNTHDSRADKIKSRRHDKKWINDINACTQFVSNYKNNIMDVGRMFIADMDDENGLQMKNTTWKIRTCKNKIIDASDAHLMQHWNPVVYRFLSDIRDGRDRGDFNDEIKCISQLLEIHGSTSMIGIERCYEEAGWTLLHIFDDLFNSLIFFTLHETTAIKEKLEILKTVKIFFLCSISRHLNMDSLNSNISFNELNNLIKKHLENCKEKSDTVFLESMKAMRCLMSSMGHFYSVSAFLTPSCAERYRKDALLYYKYKNDLLGQTSSREPIKDGSSPGKVSS